MSEVHQFRYRTILRAQARRGATAVAVAALMGLPLAGAFAQEVAPGSLDPMFGASGATPGVVTLPLGGDQDEGTGVAVEPDGHILVAGNHNHEGKNQTWVARYLEDGTLDTTFGVGLNGDLPAGVVNLTHDEGNDWVTALALGPDNHIYVGGYHEDNGSKSVFVSRLHEDGALDPEFGAGSEDGTGDGTVSISLGDKDEDLHALGVEADGHVVLVGSTKSTEDGTADWMVARLLDDGALDPAFGAGEEDGSPAGVVTLKLGGTGDEEAHAVAFEPDGHILVLGDQVHEGSNDLMVVRLLEDGKIDETFGEKGIADISLGEGDDEAVAIAVDPADEHILALGNEIAKDGTAEPFIVHLTEDGKLDETFGADTADGTPAGIEHIAVGGEHDSASGMVLEGDGHIVVVGETGTKEGKTDDLFVARVTAEGMPDETFGDKGVAKMSLSDGDDHANAVALEKDGHIVVTGHADTQAAVARVKGD